LRDICELPIVADLATADDALLYNAPEGMQFALDDESPDGAFPTLAGSTQRQYTESEVQLKNASNFNGD
jgi:hypothetical protein